MTDKKANQKIETECRRGMSEQTEAPAEQNNNTTRTNR